MVLDDARAVSKVRLCLPVELPVHVAPSTSLKCQPLFFYILFFMALI